VTGSHEVEIGTSIVSKHAYELRRLATGRGGLVLGTWLEPKLAG